MRGRVAGLLLSLVVVTALMPAAGRTALAQEADQPAAPEPWIVRVGGPGDESLAGMALLPNGDVAIAGNTEGGFATEGPEDADYWVSVLDSSGNERWRKQYGGNGGESVAALTSDARGMLYLAGAGDSWSFVACLDGEGNEVWRVERDDAAYTDLVFVADLGLVAVGAESLNPEDLPGTFDELVALATLLDDRGNVVWERRVSDFAPSIASSADADTGGEGVVVAGVNAFHEGDNESNAFTGWVVWLSESGEVRRTFEMPETFWSVDPVDYVFGPLDVAVAPDGEPVVVGASLPIPSGEPARQGPPFALRIGEGEVSGEPWDVGVVEGESQMVGVVVDGSNRVFMAGVQSEGEGTGFWLSATLSGDTRQTSWIQQMGAVGSVDAARIMIDAEGNVLLAGSAEGQWGGDSIGARDAWVMKVTLDEMGMPTFPARALARSDGGTIPFGGSGQQVSFLLDGDLWLRGLVGEAAMRLVDGEEYGGVSGYAWARNGNELAFLADAEGSPALYLLTLGDVPRLLTKDFALEAWETLDGKVGYAGDSVVLMTRATPPDMEPTTVWIYRALLIPVLDPADQTVVEGDWRMDSWEGGTPGYVATSADQRWLLFYGHYTSGLVDVEGRRGVPDVGLSSPRWIGNASIVMWHDYVDNKSIWRAYDPATGGVFPAPLPTSDAAGDEPLGDAVFSPDGQRVVYTLPEMRAVDVGDGAEAALATRGMRPWWSPDGRMILYQGRVSRPGIDMAVGMYSEQSVGHYVVAADGQYQQVIAPEEATDVMWRLQPPARWVTLKPALRVDGNRVEVRYLTANERANGSPGELFAGFSSANMEATDGSALSAHALLAERGILDIVVLEDGQLVRDEVRLAQVLQMYSTAHTLYTHGIDGFHNADSYRMWVDGLLNEPTTVESVIRAFGYGSRLDTRAKQLDQVLRMFALAETGDPATRLVSEALLPSLMVVANTSGAMEDLTDFAEIGSEFPQVNPILRRYEEVERNVAERGIPSSWAMVGITPGNALRVAQIVAGCSEPPYILRERLGLLVDYGASPPFGEYALDAEQSAAVLRLEEAAGTEERLEWSECMEATVQLEMPAMAKEQILTTATGLAKVGLKEGLPAQMSTTAATTIASLVGGVLVGVQVATMLIPVSDLLDQHRVALESYVFLDSFQGARKAWEERWRAEPNAETEYRGDAVARYVELAELEMTAVTVGTEAYLAGLDSVQLGIMAGALAADFWENTKLALDLEGYPVNFEEMDPEITAAREELAMYQVRVHDLVTQHPMLAEFVNLAKDAMASDLLEPVADAVLRLEPAPEGADGPLDPCAADPTAEGCPGEVGIEPIEGFAPEETEFPDYGRVVVDGKLNVRAGAGTDFAIVAQLLNGTEVLVRERSADGEWLLIGSEQGDGWVSAQYVDMDGGEADGGTGAAERGTLAACATPAAPEVAAFWDRAVHGCALGGASITWASYAPFEHGMMLWRRDQSRIYGLFDGGGWEAVADTWDGTSATRGRGEAPAGLLTPVRGFGNVWGSNDLFFGSLGWMRAEQKGFCLLVQEYEAATLLAASSVEFCHESNLYNTAREGGFGFTGAMLYGGGMWSRADR